MSGQLAPDQEITKETSIPVISLAELLREKVLDQIDLMKLDCEGAEYDILIGQESELYKRIDRIIMEYHDLDASKNHHLLVQYFKDLGYEVETYPNLVHKKLGYLFAKRQEPA